MPNIWRCKSSCCGEKDLQCTKVKIPPSTIVEVKYVDSIEVEIVILSGVLTITLPRAEFDRKFERMT
jgi:hypothetical protein